MARGVYSGKVSEWSIASWKSELSALIGLVLEPSHDLRKGIRSWAGSDGTRRTYTLLSCGGGVWQPLRSWRWHGDRPDVLPIFYRDQSTGVLSTVRDLLFAIRITSQVNDLPRGLVLLVSARNIDSCRHRQEDGRRHHRRSRIQQPRRSRDDRPFVISILGAIPSA